MLVAQLNSKWNAVKQNSAYVEAEEAIKDWASKVCAEILIYSICKSMEIFH